MVLAAATTCYDSCGRYFLLWLQCSLSCCWEGIRKPVLISPDFGAQCPISTVLHAEILALCHYVSGPGEADELRGLRIHEVCVTAGRSAVLGAEGQVRGF